MNRLLNFYIYLYSLNFRLNKRYVLFVCLSNLLAKILRIIFLVIIKKSNCNDLKKLSQKQDIIISLTTFPGRISSLKYTLISIFKQTILPDKIIVNLITTECPNGKKDLPKEVLEFQQYGVEFVFRDENLKPHNKYYYTFKDYPNSLIITIDDDFYYKSNLIENLLNLHKLHPNAVCSNLVRKIISNNGHFISYKQWNIYNQNVIGNEYLALGFGGVLYPAKLFDKTVLLNKNLFKEISLSTDDLWLKAIEIILNIPVTTGNFDGFPLSLETGNVNALSNDNVGHNRNDENWKKLNDYFHLSEKIHFV